jgi:hypothetical protein
MQYFTLYTPAIPVAGRTEIIQMMDPPAKA